MIDPFFLAAATGHRYCIYHAPADGAPSRGAVLYLHPFAEEMNKSRRMAALQARMLAARGVAVLQIDLHGCGDSSGDFGDARWDIWRHDVALARDWIEQRAGAPAWLWGLRLGAMLACDHAAGGGRPCAGLVLWQPVLSGEQFLTQFLRLRVASEMIGGAQANAGTAQLRGALAAGEAIEVAGYDLAPELAAAVDRLKLAELAPRAVPVHWFEVMAEAGAQLPPAAQRVTSAWATGGVELSVHAVAGEPFWTTPEITECEALLHATTAVLSEQRDGV